MLKNWGSSIFVGLVSAFLVTGLVQQMWNVEWTKAAVMGAIVFVLGIVMSQVLRRMIPTDED